MSQRPCVLVFAGHDPSGGAGLAADIQAIAAQGAHALPVVTALTVQDNNRVQAVHPVAPDLVLAQAQTLLASCTVKVIKFGIIGSADNALAVAGLIAQMLHQQPDLQVVLDPVLGSGRGHALSVDDARSALLPLLELATLITPNLPEAARLAPDLSEAQAQARFLLRGRCRDVLLKGGHSEDASVINRWFKAGRDEVIESHWLRYPGEFHGSGCTLASAIAGQLAMGKPMDAALQAAQSYTQASLREAFAIAPGQLIPQRNVVA